MAEADFWSATQAALQGEPKLIAKPKLTENLLKKPPFRFLHDIVSELQRATGYAVGLYNEEESKAENIKDKDGKVRQGLSFL